MRTDKYTWSAKNNSSYLNGERAAKTLRGAVIAARRYVMGELCGEGIITIYADGEPVRQDERSLLTGWMWVTENL